MLSSAVSRSKSVMVFGVNAVMTDLSHIPRTASGGRFARMHLPTPVQYIGFFSPTNDAMRAMLLLVSSL